MTDEPLLFFLTVVSILLAAIFLSLTASGVTAQVLAHGRARAKAADAVGKVYDLTDTIASIEQLQELMDAYPSEIQEGRQAEAIQELLREQTEQFELLGERASSIGELASALDDLPIAAYVSDSHLADKIDWAARQLSELGSRVKTLMDERTRSRSDPDPGPESGVVRW